MTGMEGGETHTVVTVNLDHVTEIGLRAVRRSYGFLGIGLGASRGRADGAFHLPGTPETDVFADVTAASLLPELRSDFALWITGLALRELLGGFGVFVDAIYESLELTFRQRWPEEAEMQQFHPLPVAEKLARLRDQHGIRTSFAAQLTSLETAANCLAMRRGLVLLADCSADDRLHIAWCAPPRQLSRRVSGLLGRPEQSDRVRLDDMEPRGRVVPNGESIALSTQDLREICFMTKVAVEEVSDRVLQRFRDRGIAIREVRKA